MKDRLYIADPNSLLPSVFVPMRDYKGRSKPTSSLVGRMKSTFTRLSEHLAHSNPEYHSNLGQHKAFKIWDNAQTFASTVETNAVRLALPNYNRDAPLLALVVDTDDFVDYKTVAYATHTEDGVTVFFESGGKWSKKWKKRYMDDPLVLIDEICHKLNPETVQAGRVKP